MKYLKTYTERINEQKYDDDEGSYIDSDYTPNWREDRGEGPQRYLNKKTNAKIAVMKFIYDSKEEGRKFSEIQKFYYEYGHPGGKRNRSYMGTKDEFRGYDSVKDRGMGSTMLSGSDWSGKPTGILHAHCTKLDNGKWILSDKKIIRVFNRMRAKKEGWDQDDMDLFDELNLF